jgi:hypothetical protein
MLGVEPVNLFSLTVIVYLALSCECHIVDYCRAAFKQFLIACLNKSIIINNKHAKYYIYAGIIKQHHFFHGLKLMVQ